MLKTLPEKHELMDWILDSIEDGQVAQLVTRKLTRAELRSGIEAPLEWQGNEDWPIVIGYPYIASAKERDKEGNVISEEKYLLDTGFDLHQVMWLEKFHGFACVRKDVYNVD